MLNHITLLKLPAKRHIEEERVPNEKRKKQCLIYCSDDNGDLASLKELRSWKTLLEAAEVCKHESVLAISKILNEGELPEIH